MIEVLLAVWITLVGVVALVPVSRSMSAWGMAFAGPLLGTAVYILAGLVLVAFDIFATATAASLATVGVAAGVLIWFVVLREKPAVARVLGAAAAAAAAAIVVAALAQSFHLTRLTTDSFHYIMSATALERTGSLVDIIPRFLLKRQLATPVLHTAGAITGRGYTAFWTPLLAVSALATLLWLAYRAFVRIEVPWRWGSAIGVAALALLLTTNRVLFHAFYINGHMLFAGLLLVGVGYAWYAALTHRWALMVPAAVAFAALVPLRAESVIVIAVFLIPIVSAAVTPQWASWTLTIPVAVATILWDVVALPPHLPEAELSLTGSVYGNVWIAGGLLLLVGFRHLASLRPLITYSPWAVLAAVLGFVAVQALRDFPLLFDSVTGIASALAATGRWSAFWWVVPLLFFGAMLVAAVPFERFFGFGIATFPIVLLALAYLRGSAFGAHSGDSANRMWMHIVFVVVLYVMVAAGEAARRSFPRVDALPGPERPGPDQPEGSGDAAAAASTSG